jgi:hypothetical protein
MLQRFYVVYVGFKGEREKIGKVEPGDPYSMT